MGIYSRVDRDNMTIAVLLKQVPDTTAKIAVSDGRVDQDSVSKWSTSPYDEYALEYALQLKESGGGDLVAITCGPSRSCLLYTSPSPRDIRRSRMPSSA